MEIEHPPGTIGISTSGYGWRHGSAVMSIMSCWKPPGTRIVNAESIDIPENMNKIIRAATGEWLWIQADDHRWGGQALRQLLDRQVDVVVPLILRRGPPFVPLAMVHDNGDGSYVPYHYKDLPTEGLAECVMAGTGGMLIRKHVFKAIEEMQGHDRWFEYEKGENLNEDFVFCRKIIEAGFKIWLDVEVVFGHVGTFTVWPHLHNGRWRLGLDMGASSQDPKASTFYFDPLEDT